MSFGLDGLDLQDFQTRSLFAASSLVKVWLGRAFALNPELILALDLGRTEPSQEPGLIGRSLVLR